MPSELPESTVKAAGVDSQRHEPRERQIVHAKRRSMTRQLHRYQIDGIALLACDEAGSEAANWVFWELQANDYRLREMEFNAGDVVVDIGAHVGLFSMYLAKRWPAIKVLAFEPFPANFRHCAENLALNKISNVILSSKAITNDNRLLRMAADPGNSGGASAIVRTFDFNGVVGDIPSITLDSVFALHEISRCKLLKIDCEGMEYEILFGTRVLDKIEYLAGEFHASPYLQSQGLCPKRLHAYCSSFFLQNKLTISFQTIPD